MLGRLPKQGRHTVWTTLQSFIPESADILYRRSALSSVLTASLELVKQGALEIRQDGAFRPIYLRGREANDHTPSEEPMNMNAGENNV
jgi:segregation and condensation protein A